MPRTSEVCALFWEDEVKGQEKKVVHGQTQHLFLEKLIITLVEIQNPTCAMFVRNVCLFLHHREPTVFAVLKEERVKR